MEVNKKFYYGCIKTIFIFSLLFARSSLLIVLSASVIAVIFIKVQLKSVRLGLLPTYAALCGVGAGAFSGLVVGRFAVPIVGNLLRGKPLMYSHEGDVITHEIIAQDGSSIYATIPNQGGGQGSEPMGVLAAIVLAILAFVLWCKAKEIFDGKIYPAMIADFESEQEENIDSSTQNM